MIPNQMSFKSYDRFFYAGGNPVNFNDPSGHMCSDPEDPTPSCEKGEKPDDNMKDNYDNDDYYNPLEETLTGGGRQMLEYFIWANSHKGWWNNFKIGSLTIWQFLGIFMLYEFNSHRDQTNTGQYSYWITEAVGHQLFYQPTDSNFGNKNTPYCKSQDCFNGILNFMWIYQGGGSDPGEHINDRFINMGVNYTGKGNDNHPGIALGENINDLAIIARKAGDYVRGKSSGYQSWDMDLSQMPFGWGNDPNTHDFLAQNPSGKTIIDLP
jgi:hypothetical protein